MSGGEIKSSDTGSEEEAQQSLPFDFPGDESEAVSAGDAEGDKNASSSKGGASGLSSAGVGSSPAGIDGMEGADVAVVKKAGAEEEKGKEGEKVIAPDKAVDASVSKIGAVKEEKGKGEEEKKSVEKVSRQESDRKRKEGSAGASNVTVLSTSRHPARNAKASASSQSAGNAKGAKVETPEKPPKGVASSGKVASKAEGKSGSPPAGVHRLTGKKRRGSSDKIQGSFLPGQLLRNAREDANLSVAQIHMATRIKEEFIRALESGDFDALPSPVFAEAYIKRLCALYEMDSEEPVELFRKHCHGKSEGHSVPDEVLEGIGKGMQINRQEEARVRRIVKVLAVFAAIAIGAVFVLMKVFPSKTGGDVDASGETVQTSAENTSSGSAVSGSMPEDGGGSSVLEKDSTSSFSAGSPSVETAEEPVTSETLEVFLVEEPFSMTEMSLPENGE